MEASSSTSQTLRAGCSCAFMRIEGQQDREDGAPGLAVEFDEAAVAVTRSCATARPRPVPCPRPVTSGKKMRVA